MTHVSLHVNESFRHYGWWHLFTNTGGNILMNMRCMVQQKKINSIWGREPSCKRHIQTEMNWITAHKVDKKNRCLMSEGDAMAAILMRALNITN